MFSTRTLPYPVNIQHWPCSQHTLSSHFLLRHTFFQSPLHPLLNTCSFLRLSWSTVWLFTIACISQIRDTDTWDRLFMLRAGFLSFGNGQVVLYYSEMFFSLFVSVSAPFSYERCMTWRESWSGGRLKPVHLILSKHRPPPLWEAYKHSDIYSYAHTHTSHTHTHNHTHIHSQSPVCMVWNGPEFSTSPGEKKKDFPRQMQSLFSSRKFCRLRGVVPLWSGKRETLIPQVTITWALISAFKR